MRHYYVRDCEMNNRDVEHRLVESGFTPKEVDIIRRWAENDNLSYLDVLSHMRLVFVRGAFVRVVLTLFMVLNFVSRGWEGSYGAFFAYFIAMLTAEFFAPSVTGAKVFFRFNYIKG